jgi:hypothetical protein
LLTDEAVSRVTAESGLNPLANRKTLIPLTTTSNSTSTTSSILLNKESSKALASTSSLLRQQLLTTPTPSALGKENIAKKV